MTILTKPVRELYRNIRGELIRLHYRRLLIRQLFTSPDTNELLNTAAIRFFTTLKWDILDTITIAISRLTDPPITRGFKNASMQQFIKNLDSSAYPDLVKSLNALHAELKSKAARIINWRNKWSGHRDFDVVEGRAPLPAMSLLEVDDALGLIGKFLNEFEIVFQDIPSEINLFDHPELAKELDEIERLKIFSPMPYDNMQFLPDDGNTIVELIKKGLKA